MILNKSILLNGLIPLSLISIYFILSLVKIDALGVQYDEILFGNAARGIIDNSFIKYSIKGFPILLMSYLGALKAYLYYLIFKIFGVSVLSVRLPMVILSAISLWILFEGVKRYFDEMTALTALVIMVFDCSFINYTRFDVGPSAIEHFCKAMSLFFFIMLLKKDSFKFIIIVMFFMGIGLFNKLNFIWFINAFIIGCFFSYRDNVKKIYINNNLNYNKIWFVVSFVIILLYYTLFLFVSNYYKLLHWLNFSILRVKIYNFIGIITGNSFYDYIFGDINGSYQYIYFLAMMICCVAGAIIVCNKYNNTLSNWQRQSFLFYLVIFVVLNMQIILTKEAINGWHTFAFYPFYPVLLASSLTFITRYFFKTYIFLIISLIIITTHQMINHYKYYIACNKPVNNIYWAKEIIDLIEYTNGKSNSFVSVNWGTHNQLITFTGKKGKYFELVYGLYKLNINNFQKKMEIINFIYSDKNRLYIMYPEIDFLRSEIMVRRKLFIIAQEAGIEFIKVKTILDESGEPIFEIFVTCIK
jgi:hypothetical protein